MYILPTFTRLLQLMFELKEVLLEKSGETRKAVEKVVQHSQIESKSAGHIHHIGLSEKSLELHSCREMK